MKHKKFAGILLTILAALELASCYSPIARTNARIEPGITGLVHLGGNMSVLKPPADGQEWNYHLQLDGQIGTRHEDTNLGLALRLALPLLSSVSPSLDAYVELPSSLPFFWGAGFETSTLTFLSKGALAPFGPYMAFTFYFYDEAFVTYTPRFQLNLRHSSKAQYFVTNQLVIGAQGRAEHGAFGSTGGSSGFVYFGHTFVTGNGMTVSQRTFDTSDRTPVLRAKSIYQFGVGFSF